MIFFSREEQNSEDDTPEEYYTVPGMYCSMRELPKQFPASWREKLDTELRARKYSPNTRVAYIHHNETLCQWLQKTPDAVTDEDIKRYLAYKEKVEKASSSSINLALSAFKFFYRYLLKRDTARDQRRPHQDRRLPVVLSKSEIKNMLEAENNLKHRLLLMMVYASGLRVSEVVRLKRQDVDWKAGVHTPPFRAVKLFAFHGV